MEIVNFCVGYMDSWEQVVHSIHYTVTVRSLTFTSGRHCCLWCHIKQGQLIEPPSVRGPVAARTIQSICEDNQKSSMQEQISRMLNSTITASVSPSSKTSPSHRLFTTKYI